MIDPNITAESPLSQFQKYGGPGFILLTTAVVLAVAWWLWTYGGVRGQGAALTLAGVPRRICSKRHRKCSNSGVFVENLPPPLRQFLESRSRCHRWCNRSLMEPHQGLAPGNWR